MLEFPPVPRSEVDPTHPLVEAILQRSPTLGLFFQKVVGSSGIEYLEFLKRTSLHQSDAPQVSDSTVELFARILQSYEIYGEEDSRTIARSLQTFPVVSTALHEGIPSIYHMQNEIYFAGMCRRVNIPFISLTCSRVSFANSTQPGAVWVRSEDAPLGMIPIRARNVTVSLMPESALRAPALEIPSRLENPTYYSPLTHPQQISLEFYQKTLEACSRHSLNQQSVDFKRRMCGDNYVSAPLETFASHIIAEDIEAQGFFYYLFTSPSALQLIRDQLDGKPKAWQEYIAEDGQLKIEKGTALFWKFIDRHAPYGKLHAMEWSDISHKSPDQIRHLLSESVIVPGVFLSMLALLSRGITPLGGYAQIGYMEIYKHALLAIARHSAMLKEPLLSEQFCRIADRIIPAMTLGVLPFSENGLPSIGPESMKQYFQEVGAKLFDAPIKPLILNGYGHIANKLGLSIEDRS